MHGVTSAYGVAPAAARAPARRLSGRVTPVPYVICSRFCGYPGPLLQPTRKLSSLIAARRSHWSAIIGSPCRSHWLRHTFACLRASAARLRYSSGLGISLKRMKVTSVCQPIGQANCLQVLMTEARADRAKLRSACRPNRARSKETASCDRTATRPDCSSAAVRF